LPGPGKYDITQNDVLRRAAGSKFGSDSKLYLQDIEKTQVTLPGPASYTPTDVYLKHNGPKFRFGSAARLFEESRKVPGPGSYELKGIMGKDGPVHSI